MSEPTPEAHRPADGNTPGAGSDHEPTVAGDSASSPAPPESVSRPGPADPSAPQSAHTPASARAPETGVGPRSESVPRPRSAPETGSADDGTRRLPDASPGSAEPTPAVRPAEPKPTAGSTGPTPVAGPGEPTAVRPAEPDAPAGPVTQTGPASDPAVREASTDPTRQDTSLDPARREAPGGPQRAPEEPTSPAPGPAGTRRMPAVEAVSDPTPPRWSGSAAVPPPPPRKRGWGESAEPTPAPPATPDLPEHRVPVDPWAGADTGGWDLPSAELPPLPPTLPYPAPPPTHPYPGPPTPAAPTSVPPPPAMPPHAGPPQAGPPQVGPPYPVPPAPPPVSPARPVSPPPGPPLPPARPPVTARPAPPPPPPAPPKQRRSKRRSAPPPAAAPPGWQAPRGYVPVPVRKRRRWPWLLLLTLACCCGCPAYYGMPIWTQYPANASLPAQVNDLALREDGRSTQAAEQLETEVRKAHWLAEDTFAGVYATSDGKRVTVFGGTGFRMTPEADADAEIARLTERYTLESVETIDTGVRGRYARCAVGRTDGTGVVVCTSVDHGSIATGVFTRLDVADSAALLDDLREQIVVPDRS